MIYVSLTSMFLMLKVTFFHHLQRQKDDIFTYVISETGIFRPRQGTSKEESADTYALNLGLCQIFIFFQLPEGWRGHPKKLFPPFFLEGGGMFFDSSSHHTIRTSRLF